MADGTGMSDSKVPLIGRLAVHYKLVSQEQLSQALADQGDHTKLGEHLVAQGLIQPKQLEKLLKIQQDMLVKHRAAKAAEAASPDAEAGAADAEAPQRPARLPKPVVEKMPLPRPPRTVPLEERPSRNAPKATPAALPGADDTFTPQAPVKERRKVQLSMGGAKPAAAPAAEAATPPASEAAEPARPAPAEAAAETSTASAPVTAGVEVGAPARPSGCEGRKETLHGFLREASDARASDLHVHSGAPLRMRVFGALETRGDAPLERADCEAMLVDVLDDAQWAMLSRHGQVDFAYDLEGVGRFRCNVYRQQRGLDGTFRLISPRPPTLEELGLPDTLARFTGFHQGMVLLTGPAGCGKSATMAALLDMVNETREEHIITVEDPIEVVHPSKKCLVNQRQVGPHTETFARALRAALREDPDIIGIGELRDLETISLALTAAETGHFVLATLHTNSAMRTINRLIGVFPPNQQSQIRTMVSESLRAVISQRLARRKDGEGRVPALEIMVVNQAVGNLIRENKTVQIQSILQTGAAHGMCLLDDSLTKLVKEGTITPEEARRHCDDPRRFGGAPS
jgi:twitching motility protein PilT